VKDYGELLAGDALYAEKAARVAAIARDLSELVHAEDRTPLASLGAGRRVAFHSPCTLQHGQRITGVVESILARAGFQLAAVRDAHLCCGAAGAYSVLQPTLSRRLRSDKLGALEEQAPELIATANIGCYMHLESGARVPVSHWIELLDGEGEGLRASR
jgi:glycolate oxidase iron-sulfur subunit